MSGTKNVLKPGNRLIADTHIWHNATKFEREDMSNKNKSCMSFFCEVVKRCPNIVLSALQHKELKPYLDRLGFVKGRKPRVEVMLDEENKLYKMKNSRLTALSNDQRKVFTSSNKNDLHLYEAALSADKMVITMDENLLAAAKSISKEIDVETVSFYEVMEAVDAD